MSAPYRRGAQRGRVTGIILSGGRARRMGGCDKGLQPFRGRPLIESVVERLAPQVDELLISANRNIDRYALLGRPVLPDPTPGFRGPLEGVQRALSQARHPLVVSVPCDAPLLPRDLVERLLLALEAADAAVAKVGSQTHPVFALYRKEVLGSLAAYMAAGGRAIHEWHRQLRVAETCFDDQSAAFTNFNTLEELGAACRSDPPAP
ncbi:MAG: molybdenum cofactor guanylyltransferase [Betaproteobacteria bacterium]|nr:molybdenum cofactor guanylyltransferase [Betaproteobacteria bacterium]